jgi:hypothetical protein
MTKQISRAARELDEKIVVGQDGPWVTVTSFGKNGDSITKTISREAAHELAIQLMQATQ